MRSSGGCGATSVCAARPDRNGLGSVAALGCTAPSCIRASKSPEGQPDEDVTILIEGREVRVRRWNNLHFARAPKTVIDVVRVDDPAFKRPLLIGTTAREGSATKVMLVK